MISKNRNEYPRPVLDMSPRAITWNYDRVQLILARDVQANPRVFPALSGSEIWRERDSVRVPLQARSQLAIRILARI